MLVRVLKLFLKLHELLKLPVEIVVVCEQIFSM